MTDEATTEEPVEKRFPPYHLYAGGCGLLVYTLFAGAIFHSEWFDKIPERQSEVIGTIGAYLILLLTILAVWWGIRTLAVQPVTPWVNAMTSAIVIVFAFPTVIVVLLMLFGSWLQAGYAGHFCLTRMRSAQNVLLSGGTYPASPDAWPVTFPECHVYRKFPPWLPAVRRPVGVNAHLLGRRIDAVPDPNNTVLFADCLPTDRLIYGPDDIDWARHDAGRCNVIFCSGRAQVISETDRGSLIFDPWKKP